MAEETVRYLRQPAGAVSSPGRRLRANWPAEIRRAGHCQPCTVVDISRAGARLRLEKAPDPCEQVWLIIANIGPIAAEVAWRRGADAGLHFFKDQQWIPQLVATRFDAAAWLRGVRPDPSEQDPPASSEGAKDARAQSAD